MPMHLYAISSIYASTTHGKGGPPSRAQSVGSVMSASAPNVSAEHVHQQHVRELRVWIKVPVCLQYAEIILLSLI